MKISLILFSIAPLCAQVALEPPSFGCHADSTGRLRRLTGVRANLTATLAIPAEVSQGLCNSRYTLYQEGGQVVLSTSEGSVSFVAPGAVKLALGESVAVAVDAAGGEIHYSQGGDWEVSPFQPGSPVLAVRLVEGRLILLTAGECRTINIVSGATEAFWKPAIPGAPLAILADRSILTNVDEEWMRCAETGCEGLGIAPGGVRTLAPLHDDWLSATLETGMALAVRVVHGEIESFRLPGAIQE